MTNTVVKEIKKTLITGGTGQGSAYLAGFLLGKGYEVHGIKRPTSLFLNERLQQLLDHASQQYDIVIVNAPPALLVSDVAAIGPHMGATFMAARDGASTLGDLRESVKPLGQASVEVRSAPFSGKLKRISRGYRYGHECGYKYDNATRGNE